jgi:hypothetical protein
MGIKMILATLGIVGVMGGSAFGATAMATPVSADTTQPPKIECAYNGDCTRDQLKIQDNLNTGDKLKDHDQLRIRDCAMSLDGTPDQLRTQDCDGTHDQLKSQDRLHDGTAIQDQLHTQDRIHVAA